MNKINLIFILEHFYPHIGGAEKLFFNLINELRLDKRFQITVLTSNSGGITGVKKYSENFLVYYFNWPSFFGHPIPLFKDVKNFIKKADLVHTGTYTSGFFSFFYAKFFKKKIVLTVYENLFHRWFFIENFIKATLFFLFEFITVHLPFDFYIAISKATKKDLKSVFIDEKKIEVVYPFLEEKFRIRKKTKEINGNYFLYYGRPGKTKGLFILLKAINLIRDQLKKNKIYFNFILSFDPFNERNKIISFIKKRNLNSLIKVLPPQSEKKLLKIISNCKCVIIPSITEGFGYTTYEAIQLKKPVIISNTGSLKEIVSGNYLIFKNRDFNDLANKIIKAINGKFLYNENIFFIDKKLEIKKLKKIYLLHISLDKE